MPWLTAAVLTPFCFSTTSIRLEVSSTIPSPMIVGGASTIVATSARVMSGLAAPSTETLPRVALSVIGDTCWTLTRCWGRSRKPPRPGVEASRKLKGETQSALPVVATTWSRETPCCCMRTGSAWTWSWRSRIPHTETLATPSTLMSFGRMVHRDSTERSTKDWSADESPIIMTRLAADVGCNMTGALDAFVNRAPWVSRSCTTCRARISSVPSSKVITIEDSPAIEIDCMVSTHATPLSRFDSSGTVTRSSTSWAESPSASDWTSTVTGANSGTASMLVRVIWKPAKAAAARVRMTTRTRARAPVRTR